MFFWRWLILSLIVCSSLLAAPKAILFNDTSAWYHWGCTGTSTALKEQIQKLGFALESIPINTTYGLQDVPPFEEFDSVERFDRFTQANETVCKQIQNNEIVLITGEGTIHDLRLGPRALLYLAHISKKFLHKHVEIINHSAYPKDDPLFVNNFLHNCPNQKGLESDLLEAELLYKTVYNELDFIAIREQISQSAMDAIDVSSTLSFDCLPLYIRDHYDHPKQVDEKTVVIAGSVAFSESGVEQLCLYMEHLHERGYTLKVLTGAAAFPARDDEAFVQCLQSYAKVPFHRVTASSMEEWLNTINQAKFLVSGRFHHSIAAFCLNTPFIALNSNTHKVHAICALLAQEPPLLFADPNLVGHLLERTEAILSGPVPSNQAKIQEICELAEKNFDGLRNFSLN